METKDDACHLVRMLGAPVQNELGHIDSGRAGRAAGLTVETSLHDSFRIEIAIVLIGHDLEPTPRTHVFRLKYVVDWADGVTLGTGCAGF